MPHITQPRDSLALFPRPASPAPPSPTDHRPHPRPFLPGEGAELAAVEGIGDVKVVALFRGSSFRFAYGVKNPNPIVTFAAAQQIVTSWLSTAELRLPSLEECSV